MSDSMVYDKSGIVYVRFPVSGKEENLETFIKELPRSGLRIRLAVDSPWRITDDDRILRRTEYFYGAIIPSQEYPDCSNTYLEIPERGIKVITWRKDAVDIPFEPYRPDEPPQPKWPEDPPYVLQKSGLSLESFQKMFAQFAKDDEAYAARKEEANAASRASVKERNEDEV